MKIATVYPITTTPFGGFLFHHDTIDVLIDFMFGIFLLDFA